MRYTEEDFIPFPTLRAEMARRRLMFKDIAVSMGKTSSTVGNRLRGKSDFTHSEMIKIRDTLFPKLTIGYLFFDEEAHRLPNNVVPLFK